MLVEQLEDESKKPKSLARKAYRRAMNDSTDNPGVIARPPLLYAGTLIVALLVNLIWPLPIFADKLGRWCGLVLLLLGAGIIAWGRNSLVSGGTPVDPTQATTATSSMPIRSPG